jgi:hypothetical protein
VRISAKSAGVIKAITMEWVGEVLSAELVEIRFMKIIYPNAGGSRFKKPWRSLRGRVNTEVKLKKEAIMSKPDKMMIDEVKYIRADSIPENKNLSSDIRIVILQRGWVAVGRFSQSGSDCELKQASIIRKWGTDKGLGQLISGPLTNTILDTCGNLRFHELAIVATMDCEASKWSQCLK